MTKRHMKYNPSFLTEEELIDSFVVRHSDLEIIVGIIGENVTDSNQHVLVIGPRGSGKTTLVYRVAAEIEQNMELRDRWYPVIFSEESYEVVSAGEFWLEALFHLSEQVGDEKWRRTYVELKGESDDQRLAGRALSQLLDFADSQGKRILLIVENLNMLLGDLPSDDEAWKIRHTLINEPRLMLLATATNRFEHIENSSQAMFEMFKMQELKPLDDDECNRIWEQITGQKLLGERIKPIRILTGGNPRLLTIIAKFSAHRSFRKLLDDLVDLIDDHTEYFKSHLDNLPPIERKVYLALAGLWDASTAREIAQAARLDVNKTSSLLSRLINRGAVVVEEHEKKTKWYVVAERMYNIYYLMRRRGKPADRVKATVKFLVSMYDPESAARLISEEACGLSPELRRDHYLAYEVAINGVQDRQRIERIIASTPKSFLESLYLSEALKNFMVTENNSVPEAEHTEQVDAELMKAKELNNKGVNLFKEDSYEQALLSFSQVIETFGSTKNATLLCEVARAMANRGITLGKLNHPKEAITACDEMIVRFADATEPELRNHVARAMFNKGITLGELNRPEEAITACDELIARFADATEPELRKRVAGAMFLKGITLSRLNRPEGAITACDELITRFADATDPELRNQVAGAMLYKGMTLGKLNRREEEITEYDEMIASFADANEPELRKQLARAVLNKGITLGRLNRPEEAITTYDEVTTRFADATEPELRERVAGAMFLKGITLGKLNRPEEKITAYDEMIARFADATEPELREKVAVTMVNKGIALGQLNRPEEAITAYDEMISRFADATEPELRKQVGRAMLNKVITLDKFNRPEEAITAYDEMIARFADATEPELRKRVGRAMLNKGVTLGQLNRPEEAITTYDELITRFADATDPELREKVAKALLYKGITLGQLNRPEEAITTCEQMIARFADATEPELREQVADALLYRGILFEKLNKYPEAEHSLRKAIEFAPDSTEPDGKLIDLLLKMPERHDEALQTAEEIIGKKPDNPELLNSVAWTFYQHNKLFMLSQAERWATKAVSLMPNNVRAHHTLACILSALGKGTEALEPARRYIQDISVVEETIEDAIELFVELAASGYSKEALGILVNSEAEKHLEPLVVGLRLYVGEDVKTAPEIREVAKDVMNRIKERVKARKLINK